MEEIQPYAIEYLKALDLDIQAVEDCLKNGTNIGDWVQYQKKLAERKALLQAKSRFAETVKKIAKGDDGGA